ncbi:MAG: Type II secretory pathway, pseudopilin PulG [Streptococcaceae bacterium]|jgi:type II secretory pathway component PulJ|nr:Type II secretory pathway, pseudopilin PulG [Streptococcaceae bacterium]
MNKKHIRAYILLESLIALALLATITTVILGQISASHRAVRTYNQRIEELNTANMALASGKSQLSENGVNVSVQKNAAGIVVQSDGKEVLQLEIQTP